MHSPTDKRITVLQSKSLWLKYVNGNSLTYSNMQMSPGECSAANLTHVYIQAQMDDLS